MMILAFTIGLVAGCAIGATVVGFWFMAPWLLGDRDIEGNKMD